jgi:hypothetical protein
LCYDVRAEISVSDIHNSLSVAAVWLLNSVGGSLSPRHGASLATDEGGRPADVDGRCRRGQPTWGVTQNLGFQHILLIDPSY